MKKVILTLMLLGLFHTAIADENNSNTCECPGGTIQVKEYLMGIGDAATKGNRSISFMIEVENVGETVLSNVIVTDFLPANMLFRKSEAAESITGTDGTPVGIPLDGPTQIVDGANGTTNIIWKLMDVLNIDEQMKIYFDAEAKEGTAYYFANKASATGYFRNVPCSDTSKNLFDARP